MTTTDIDKFRVVGIAVRTSHRTENSTKQRIPHLWKRFLEERVIDKIPNRVDSQKVFAIYTEYDSDEYGKYTYIIGMEVSEFSNIPEGMIGKTIKQDNYEMLPSENGPFNEAVPKAWKKARSDADLKDKRKFDTDFVSYDMDEGESKGKVQLYVSIAS